MGPGRLDPGQHGGADIARGGGASDESRPGARSGSELGSPADSELECGASPGRFGDEARLGGDERLVGELVEQRRLEDLGRSQRPLDDRQCHSGVDHPSLGDRPDP